MLGIFFGPPTVMTLEGRTIIDRIRRSALLIFLAGILLLILIAAARALQLTEPTLFSYDAGTLASTLCFIVLLFGIPLSAAMLLAAIIVFWSAGSNAHTFEAFHRGGVLADWRFTAGEWDAYLNAEWARFEKSSFRAALSLIWPCAAVAAILLWQLSPSVSARAWSIAVVGATAGLALWLTRLTRKALHRNRIAALHRNPRVLIGESAVYCGGVFRVWNVGMTVLQSARLLPGQPMMLELAIGSSKTLRFFDFMIGVASLAGGAHGVAASGVTQERILLPVPESMHDDAARVLADLITARQ